MVKFKGLLYACLSAITFGMIPLFAKRAILDGVHNDTILAYRYTLAALLYGVFLLLRGISLKISWRQTKEVALVGVGGYGLTAFFLFLSYLYMPAGIATSIHYLYPVVVAVLMAVFFNEQLLMVIKYAIIMAIVGVGLLSWSGGEVHWLGIVFVLLSTLTYGIYIVSLNRTVLKEMSADVLTFWVLAFSSMFYILLAWVRGNLVWIPEPEFILDMTLFALVCTVISARLLVAAVNMVGAVTASVLGTLEPITAIFIGIFFFHEPFKFLNFIGLCLVILSVLLVILFTHTRFTMRSFNIFGKNTKE